MKKLLIVLLAVMVGVCLASPTFAGVSPGTGIKSSSHDLSTSSGKGSTWAVDADPTLDRICIYCHAPHHTVKAADAGVDYYPLWNHEMSTTASYTVYDNGAEDPSDTEHQIYGGDPIGQPGSVSKLCLSCHDGSVAVASYGYYDASSQHTGTTTISGKFLVGDGGDLTNHHPIGFDYTEAWMKDGEIADPSTAMNAYYTIGELLWGGNMECATCHDVHNTKNEGGKFLWKEDTGSQFCLTCHLK